MHQVGAGVLGPVFRAYHPAEDRPFIVKALHIDLPPEQVQSLVAALEELADAGPVHPGVVLPVAAGDEGGRPWFAAEYVEADSPDAPPPGRAAAAEALALLEQLAAALDAAHARGLRHGALHPRDVLRAADAPRVTGFGIVPALEQAGLPGPARRPYTAPEILAGHSWGPEADRYALAAVACELLAGRRAAVAREQVAAVVRGVGDVSSVAALQSVLDAALDADPSRRPASAAEIVAELAAALGMAPAAASQPVTAVVEASAASDAPAEDLAPLQAGAGEDHVAAAAADVAEDAAVVHAEPPVAADAPSDQSQLDLLDAPALDDERPYVPETSPGPDELPPLPHAAPRQPARPGWWPAAATALAVLALAGGAAAYLTVYSVGGDTPQVERGPEPPLPAATAPPTARIAPVAQSPPVGPAAGSSRVPLAPRPEPEVVAALPAASEAVAPRLPAPAPAEPAAAAPRPVPAAAPSPPAPPAAAPSPDSRTVSGPSDTPPPAATGWVLVRTVPLGATVRIDGADRGRTPLSLRDVPFGRRVVEVRRDGFEAVTREVQLSSADPVAAIGLALSPLPAAETPGRGAAR